MPAIQPARLKQQAALLSEHFDDPAVFVHKLHYLLEFYADRVKRPGQAGKPAPLTTAYKVHFPVLRQIQLELADHVVKRPASTIALCEALWGEPVLEFRMLAAMLLGDVPASEAQAVIECLSAWLKTDLEGYLVDALLDYGLRRLRNENPNVLTEFIGEWINSQAPFYQQLGLRALLPLVNEPDYHNLPMLYRLIHPLMRSAPTKIRPDLLEVLGALGKRSPQETAYYLRQNLMLEEGKDTPWLVRQMAGEFPEEIGKSLKDAARESERRKREGR